MMRRINHSKPTLTVFSDASIYHEERVAGWGGWASGDDRQPFTCGGKAPFSKRSDIVELWAISLTLQELAYSGYLRETDKSILLQSDSLEALRFLSSSLSNSYVSARDTGSSDILSRRRASGEVVAPIKEIRNRIGKRDVVYLRHVKGHRGGKTARSWVNELCDKRARAEARAQIRGAA